MTVARLHIVGAGVAGLAAALHGVRAGWRVELHEASPAAGGRCREVRHADGRTGDNGTHTLVGANRHALAFLDAIGSRTRWIEPEPDGLPVADLAHGCAFHLGVFPWGWLKPDRRPPGLTWRDLLRAARLGLPGPDCPVAAVAGEGPLARAVIEPLTVAALNTPYAEASARRLAPVLRRLVLPGGGRILVAERGLGPDLVEPALAALREAGVTPAYNRRLTAIALEDGRARRLTFANHAITLEPGDAAILALPAFALRPLLPDLPLPDRFEPIANLHYPCDYAGPVRFVGLLGTHGQWLLLRPGAVSVTISAARAEAAMPADDLAALVWREVRAAAALVGLPVHLPEAAPLCHVIKEKRATVRQAVGDGVRVPPRPLANLSLAGDWLSVLPATIEAAVASGRAAVRRLGRPPMRRPLAVSRAAARAS